MLAPKEHRAVVLVVEDEAILRLDAATFLFDAGYDVVEASDALQALAALETQRIDVLFTDINMPGPIDGLELARQVRKTRPGVHLVVTSGKFPPAQAPIPEDGAFIAKPYSPETVTKVMSRMLS